MELFHKNVVKGPRDSQYFSSHNTALVPILKIHINLQSLIEFMEIRELNIFKCCSVHCCDVFAPQSFCVVTCVE